jgi:hypothetical protein
MNFCVPKRFEVTSDINYNAKPHSLIYYVSGNGILQELNVLDIDYQENRDRVHAAIENYFQTELRIAPELPPLAGIESSSFFSKANSPEATSNKDRIALGIYTSEDLNELSEIGFNAIRSMYTNETARNIPAKHAVIWGQAIYTGFDYDIFLPEYISFFTAFEMIHSEICNNYLDAHSANGDQPELDSIKQTLHETMLEIKRSFLNTRAVMPELYRSEIKTLDDSKSVEITLTFYANPRQSNHQKVIKFVLNRSEIVEGKSKLEYSFDIISQEIWDNIFKPDQLVDYLDFGDITSDIKDVEVVLPKTVWTHRNGCEYMVVMISNKDSVRAEYKTQITYVGKNGKIWTKDQDSFLIKMNKRDTTETEIAEFEKALSQSIYSITYTG